jgi:osmotically-inducible protein OsmY
MKQKQYRATYYVWYTDGGGKEVNKFHDHWVDDRVLRNLENDKDVDGLIILEERMWDYTDDPKRYRVTYYEWSFDRHGDKDYTYMDHWVSASILADLQKDSMVDELEIHEEMEDME